MNETERFLAPTEWYSDTDLLLADTVARWAERELVLQRAERGEDFAELLAPALRSLCIEIGVQRLFWPDDEKAVPRPADHAMSVAAVLEQVGRADVGLGCLLCDSFALQALAIAAAGDHAARRQELATQFERAQEPAIVGLILPDYATSGDHVDLDGLTCQAEAVFERDRWIIRGRGARSTGAGADASLFGVVARTTQGPALFLVPAESGVSRGETILKTGLAASRNADLDIEATLAKSAMIGAGAEAVRGLCSWRLAGLAAVCLGAGRAAWRIVKDWSETRVIKGKGQIFKENPLVASALGDIGAALGVGRPLACWSARMLARPDLYGDPGSPAVSTAVTAAARQVARDIMGAINRALELMGSAGYATEWQIERYWRDIKMLETTLGPSASAQVALARHYFDLQTL